MVSALRPAMVPREEPFLSFIVRVRVERSYLFQSIPQSKKLLCLCCREEIESESVVGARSSHRNSIPSSSRNDDKKRWLLEKQNLP